MSDPCSSELQAEGSSKLEFLLIEHVCKPILNLIPAGVRPNSISLVNHLICWLTAVAAYVSTIVGPLGRMLALFGAAAGTFSMAVGDSLDGMQARKTDQCSKLGEMMDHWLDAIHQPMVTFGVAIALSLDPWEAALLHITSTMIYNVQLLLYHRTGRFVAPDTSGVDAQLGTTLLYIIFGIFFYWVDRDVTWVSTAITAMIVLVSLMQIKLILFYYKLLGKMFVHHLPVLLLCAGFAALYLLGVMGQVTFLLSIVLLSFRISGSYVLFTIVGQSYRGYDLGVALLLIAIFIAHTALAPVALGPWSLAAVLPWLTMVYIIARNLVDFVRHYRTLAPTPTR